MARIKIKSYVRKSKRVKAHTRKKRPKGKKKIVTKEKFVLVRDEFGRVLGYEPIKKKRRKK